jgi:hypothetical protein
MGTAQVKEMPMTPEPKELVAMAYGMAGAALAILALVCYIAIKATTCWA